MNEETPRNKVMESNIVSGSQRRRSPRLNAPPQADGKLAESKMAIDAVPVKRSITVRKIAPRKTAAASDHDKENTPRRPEPEGAEQKRKVSTPGRVPGRRGSSAVKKKKAAAMPSPILPSPAQQPPTGPQDEAWPQKARRSYSRLGDKSFSSPASRDTLFGFEKLKTPAVVRAAKRCGTDPEASRSGSGSAHNSFAALLEAEDCGSALPGPDPDIPGVAVVKEKRRRKKVPQMNSAELEQLAAQMNAEFEEAAEFELVVE